MDKYFTYVRIYFVSPLHHENKTSVEFILTNLFGYLIRTGCTGTPGTKAPMEVKRVANKHLSFILFVLFVLSYIHTS